MTKQINKDLRYYLSEFIGGVILFVILGFPFWLPVILIIDDLLSPLNVFRQMAVGQSISLDQIFFQLIQYLVHFIPGVIILVWWVKDDSEKMNAEIDASFISKIENCSKSNKVLWKPKGITGNPKNSAEWKELKSGIYGFKSNYRYQFFTYPIVIGSLLYMLLKIMIAEVTVSETIFSIAGLIFIVAVVCNLAFYLMSHSGVWVKELEKKVQVGKYLLDYSEIEFVQLLSKTQTHTSGGSEPYSVYEANVIYNNDERYNMLNHGELDKFIEQVRTFNSYINRPVVASDQLLIDIDSHNQEAKLGQ